MMKRPNTKSKGLTPVSDVDLMGQSKFDREMEQVQEKLFTRKLKK